MSVHLGLVPALSPVEGPHGVRAYFKAVKIKGVKNTRNESEPSRHKHTSEHAASHLSALL